MNSQEPIAGHFSIDHLLIYWFTDLHFQNVIIGFCLAHNCIIYWSITQLYKDEDQHQAILNHPGYVTPVKSYMKLLFCVEYMNTYLLFFIFMTIYFIYWKPGQQ